MPFITAREDAGLSRTPNSQDIDALVPGGHRIAVDWVQHQDDGNGLGQVRLAGNYTCPETHMMLNVGDVRFINCTRFEIPSSAWLAKTSPMTDAERNPTSRQASGATPQSSNDSKSLKSLASEMISRYEGFREDAILPLGQGATPGRLAMASLGSTTFPFDLARQ